jgi:hypothetical protein
MSAAEDVQQRLLKVAAALEQAAVPYAVIGGNAVASWVGSVDRAAVRLTRDVDILLNRTDLEAAKVALTSVGFFYHETLDIPLFLDGPEGSARDAVHVLFAGEKVQPDYAAPTPSVAESEQKEQLRVLSLEALVRMKLTSFRDKDRVHVRDLVGVGLIDATWLPRFQPELAARLQQILDNPNG